MSELRISTEQVCFIAAKARAVHAQVAASGQGEGSNPTDDGLPALEMERGDPVRAELEGAVAGLNGAELADLIGLAWLGRDGGGIEDWPEILRLVADQAPERPATALIEMPLLGDYLELGLEAFGLSCADGGAPVDLTAARP